MIKVEFTIEPFVDGDPPPLVTATVEALERLGITVEIGPFGSSFTVSEDLIGEAMATLARTAYANGATHVALDTETV